MKKDILTLRIGARERRLLDELQAKLKLSRSELVREAIVRYASLKESEADMTVAEKWAPWIGIIKGGTPIPAREHKKRYAEALAKKHERRPR
jgi:Tfp pilus assembly protein FimT